MSLGMLILIVWLGMMGLTQTGLVVVPALIVGIFALVAATVLAVEGCGGLRYMRLTHR